MELKKPKKSKAYRDSKNRITKYSTAINVYLKYDNRHNAFTTRHFEIIIPRHRVIHHK